MRSASAEFKRKMNNGGSFYQTGKVVFADGTELDLGAKDFYMAGNSFTDGAGTTAFPLGEAIAKKINISLVNDDDRFSEYDFFGAKITVYLNCALENGTESLLIGTFTVTEPEAYGTKVEVVATDDMYKADTDYLTDLEYPATIGAILTDSCSTLSIPLLSTRFTNDSFMVATKPEGITHRQLWGMIAMIAGGNARMDEYNRLQIVEYDFSYFETKQGLDGGSFKLTDGDNADGGNFTDYSSGDSIDGGDFAELNQYHYFHRIKAPTVATDDVVITGIQTEIGENVYLNGEEGYVLRIENSLIESNPEGALALIGARIIGLKFRPFTLEHASYPLAEFGDICYVSDRKGNVYQSVVTDIEFIYWGYTSIKCAADSPLRNSSKYTSGKTQAIVAARKETQKKLEAYDLQMQQLNTLMSQAFGVFMTEEKQEDGSAIYYLHNKPELVNSDTIWKMTAGALAVSTDGGQTWNAGIDSEGNAVMNVLTTVGINFDWAKGGTLKLGGKDNIDGKIEVYDADGNMIGLWDSNGASISGDVDAKSFFAKNAVNLYDESREYFIKALYIVNDGEDVSRVHLNGGAIGYVLVDGGMKTPFVDTDKLMGYDENGNSVSITVPELLKKATLGSVVNFHGIHLGASEAIPYIYTENNNGNIYFRFTDANGNNAYTNLRTLVGKDSVEYGSNENGKYYKFSNGTLICSKKHRVENTGITSAQGSAFGSAVINTGKWAMSFNEDPILQGLTFQSDSTSPSATIDGAFNITASGSGEYFLRRDTSATVNGYIHVSAIGRWK